MPVNLPVNNSKGGRPMKALTDNEIELVENMAGFLNKKQIAAALGIAEHTFIRICRENESVDVAYKKGKAHKVLDVAQALKRNAVNKNNVLAQIFYLKTQGDYVESQPEQEKPTINISYSEAGRERDITPQKLQVEYAKGAGTSPQSHILHGGEPPITTGEQAAQSEQNND